MNEPCALAEGLNVSAVGQREDDADFATADEQFEFRGVKKLFAIDLGFHLWDRFMEVVLCWSEVSLRRAGACLWAAWPEDVKLELPLPSKVCLSGDTMT